MAKKRFIVQDRFCELCSAPAALLVVTAHKDDPHAWPVCSYDHGEMLIDQLDRGERVVKSPEVPGDPGNTGP